MDSQNSKVGKEAGDGQKGKALKGKNNKVNTTVSPGEENHQHILNQLCQKTSEGYLITLE